MSTKSILCNNFKDLAITNAEYPQLEEENLYPDIKIIRLLAKSRSLIYLVYSSTHRSYFAMKVFPQEKSEISRSFLSELRVSYLSHPNIINVVEARSNRKGLYKGKYIRISFLLLEFAPYGDLARNIMKGNIPEDDAKLTRALFRQLIEGIEYLHSKEIAHLDVKLDNLLLGENFKLKIADFDFCANGSERFLLGTGTENFRAPEIKAKTCKDFKAADIYSAGICLFVLLAHSLPYSETKTVNGYDLLDLLLFHPSKFWETYDMTAPMKENFSPDFIDLFEWMTRYDPTQRPTLNQIKLSKWFNGPFYTEKETIKCLSKNFETMPFDSN